MEKTELKQRLEEVKTKLKSICKDAHYADALISDLVSLKGQLDHEPTLVHVPISGIDRSIKGNTFEMHITKDGQAVYHAYGGYTIVVDPRMSGLHSTIREFIDFDDNGVEYTDEEKEMILADRDVTAWVLSAPMYAFSNIDLKYKIATDIVEWINSFASDLLDANLPEDDVAKNIEFEQSVREVEELKNVMLDAEREL